MAAASNSTTTTTTTTRSTSSWHHNYKELEVNALNTVWNLLLDKPYQDGGQEHSGRVASSPSDDLYYEVHHQHSATQVVSGQLNAPDHGAVWTFEAALAVSDLVAVAAKTTTTTTTTTPAVSSSAPFWRINWSRVELCGVVNWTWQPQVRWDPATARFRGFVDMHLPDAWGYLVFDDTKDSHVDSHDEIMAPRDYAWPLKLAAMTLYYAQHYYYQQHGKFTDALSDLVLPPEILQPLVVELTTTTSLQDNDDAFEATVSYHRTIVNHNNDALLG